MKKRLFIILLILILALLPFALTACIAKQREAGLVSPPAPLTALVLGTDDAAQNTDVILVLHYQVADNTLSVMQIPRDTYLESGLGTPKINHIFPALLAKGNSERAALAETADILSDALGINFDAAIALRPQALAHLVDEIGGVPINLPMPLTYDDPDAGLSIRLPAGEQILDGEAAVHFVRYRSGYLEGDLGRVDAQKIFLAALIHRVQESMDISHMLSLLFRPPQGITLLADKLHLVGVAKHFYQNKSVLRAIYFSLPGEAVQIDSGAWYYAINRTASAKLIEEHFSLSSPKLFDPARRFCGQTIQFENIYFAAEYPYRVFTADEIQDIIIKKRE